MQNLTSALVVLVIEAVLIGLIGVVYLMVRRYGGRRAPAEPPQDLKPLACQLVQVHEAMVGLYDKFFAVPEVETGTAAPSPDGAESALRKSVAGLRCVAGQVATGRVTAAEVGQGLLDAHEQLLTAWREYGPIAPAPPDQENGASPRAARPRPPEGNGLKFGEGPAKNPPGKVAAPVTIQEVSAVLKPDTITEDELDAAIRDLGPLPDAIPQESRVLSETEIEALMLEEMNGTLKTDGLRAIPEQDMPHNDLVDSLLDLSGVFPKSPPQSD